MQPDAEDHELRSVDTLREGIPPSPVVSPPRHGLTRQRGWKHGVRYRRGSAILLAFYLVILLLPWVVTALMMFRPVNFKTYHDPGGSITPRQMEAFKRWRAAMEVLRTVSVTLGLPIVSALLAQGAIVYTQRTKPGQNLNVLQMFALADRTWLSPPRLLRVQVSDKPTGSLYLWLAAGLVVITGLQPFLQSILVTDETLTIMTCRGHPSWGDGYMSKDYDSCLEAYGISGIVAGYDPDPVALNNIPQILVVQKALDKIVNVGAYDEQMHLWPSTGMGLTWYDEDGVRRNNFDAVYKSWDVNSLTPGRYYFASSITNNTNTGVYREHAARMDSKAKCYNVSSSSFPKNCKGDRPLEASFSQSDTQVDVCVEGNYTETPWSTSRDKQEHSERLWLHVNTTAGYFDGGEFTLKCESTSRRGWFELPNRHNGFEAGPLLDVWPSQEELARDFNDYNDPWESDEDGRYPTRKPAWYRPMDEIWTMPAVPHDVALTDAEQNYWSTPGPLMTAALALFGNSSFFHAAATADKDEYNQTVRMICEQGRLPFGRVSMLYSSEAFGYACKYYDDDLPTLSEVVGMYFLSYEEVNVTSTALEMAMFFVNEAQLTLTATDNWSAAGRPIRSAPGDHIVKPVKSIPALVVVSFFLLLQVVGLGVLIRYIYSAPTWTSHLDADALAQIGGQIKDLGEPRPALADVSGLVGVVEHEHADDSSSMRTAVVETIQLAIGAKGVISAETARALKPERPPIQPRQPPPRQPMPQRNVYS